MLLRQQSDTASTVLVHSWVMQGVEPELLAHTLHIELDRLLYSTARGNILQSLSCPRKLSPSQASGDFAKSWKILPYCLLVCERCLVFMDTGVHTFRGTSLTRKRLPIGPFRRLMPRVLGGSFGGGRFLMGEAPLYRLFVRLHCLVFMDTGVHTYRGTSLMRKPLPLGPYIRPMPMVPGGS